MLPFLMTVAVIGVLLYLAIRRRPKPNRTSEIGVYNADDRTREHAVMPYTEAFVLHDGHFGGAGASGTWSDANDSSSDGGGSDGGGGGD